MTPPSRALSRPEFIALMAMISASVALSIDAMLPALPEMARDLGVEGSNDVQLVITSFVLGMGVGTLFTGPLCDSFGRRRVVLIGALLYALTAAASFFVQDLPSLLLLRFLSGLAVAGPRVAVIAIIRDRYAGRDMAQVVSFVMMVFALVPAIAPLLGQGIIAFAGWRGVFAAFVVFAAFYAAWFGLRQPETLAPEHQRPLGLATIGEALREVLGNSHTVRAILAQGCAFGILFATISTIQQIYEVTFARADSFVWWWALITVFSAGASVLNASVVLALGMRRIVTTVMAAEAVLCVMITAIWFAAPNAPSFFYVFLFWQFTVFSLAGLTIGNLNAMALEPLGHIAGLAASTTTALATVLAVLIAVPIGLAFDCTPIPLILGVAVAALSATLLMMSLPRVLDA